MNGAQHWRKAEAYLAAATDVSDLGMRLSDRDREFAVSRAQVHATLALAAATLATSNRRVTDADDWAEAIRGA